MSKKLLFIINPHSGNNSLPKNIESIIKTTLDKEKFEFHIRFTKHAGHAEEIAQSAVEDDFNIIVAIGGDGTVNKVGKNLINTNATLGIIPTGSGNGFARHFKIPLTIREAVKTINNGNIEAIDTGIVNGQYFLNVAGIGFDAHIGNLFNNKDHKRGFMNYARLVIKELLKYKPETYLIKSGDQENKVIANMICFANSSQFGNNAYIAPSADIQDKLLDICIIKKFPLWRIPEAVYRLFNKSIEKFPFYESFQSHNLMIHRENSGIVQLDGEPFEMDSTLEISTNPASLTVIVP